MLCLFVCSDNVSLLLVTMTKIKLNFGISDHYYYCFNINVKYKTGKALLQTLTTGSSRTRVNITPEY